MKNILLIFDQRITKESESRSSYYKYIFNSHLVMFLLIVFGAILFNYSRWLNTASEVQSTLILVIVLSLLAYILTVFKVKTFIKEADVVFLLPLEENYKKLKNKLVIPTIITQFFVTGLFFTAVYPIIKKLNISFYYILTYVVAMGLFIIIATLFKYDKVVRDRLEIKDYSIIFLVYLLITINLAIVQKPIISTVLALLFALINKVKDTNINWFQAADYDMARNERFLKFVNMFVDVPINSVKVSRRKYLDIFLPKITSKNFKTSNSYGYYYSRAFLRQENSIFLVFRLLLVALLFIYSLNNVYVSIIVIISFNYLTIIQLIPLYRKFNSLLWMNTIPVNSNYKVTSFKKIVLKVLFISTVILFVLASIINFSFVNIGYLAIAVVCSVVLNNFFLKKLK